MFRQDLFFRLNVAPLPIPPLRERPADIDALSDYFARKYAEQNGLPVPVFAAAARAMLRSCAWPGNVRELENIVHRAVVLTGGATIVPSVLDPDAREGQSPAIVPVDLPRAGFVARSLTQMEQDLILSTLVFTRGNRTHAATILGISIRALRNKLRDYADRGIDVPAPMSPGAG
jgi:DNA-binding NtrC family response regulator